MKFEEALQREDIRQNFIPRGRQDVEDFQRPKTPHEERLLEQQKESDRKFGVEAEKFFESYLKYELSVSTEEDDAAVLPGVRKFSIPLKSIAGLYVSRGSGLLSEELERLAGTLSDADLEENKKLTKNLIHSNAKRGASSLGGSYTRSEMSSTTTYEPEAVAYSANRVRRLNKQTGKVEPIATRVVFDILVDEDHPPEGYVPEKVLFGPHNEILFSDGNTYQTVGIKTDADGIVRITVNASKPPAE